jgi:uncharacterized membrane protein
MGVTPTDQPAVVQSESVFFAGNNNCVTRRCLQDYIPESLPARIGADTVDKILGIIASSMLAVTTFSFSTRFC